MPCSGRRFGKPLVRRCLWRRGAHLGNIPNIPDCRCDPTYRLRIGDRWFTLGVGQGLGFRILSDRKPLVTILIIIYYINNIIPVGVGQGRLDVDVSFIVEGEEESGLSLNQRGLMELVEQHKAWFTPCRAIIIR